MSDHLRFDSAIRLGVVECCICYKEIKVRKKICATKQEH